MKHFLILIGILFCFTVNGQKKISAMDATTTVSSGDVLPVVRSGANYKVAKHYLQETLRDSIKNLWTRLAALEELVYSDNPVPSIATLQVDYRFEQDSADETAYNRDFTPGSNFSYTDAGTDGARWMGLFQGVNQYVSTPSIPNFTDITVMADVRIGNTNEPYRVAAGNLTVADGGWQLVINPYDETVSFVTAVETTDSVYTGDVFNIVTSWPYDIFRVAATSDGDIYVNGVKQATTGSIVSGFGTGGVIRLGQSIAGTSHIYGSMDNFKLYDGALSAAEIYNEYLNNEYVGDTSDLIRPVTSSLSVASQDVLLWNINESILSTNDSLIDALTYTANAVEITIDSMRQEGQSFTFYTADVQSGDVLLLDYNASYYSGIKDLTGNAMASFTDAIVTNELIATSEADIQYLFENNAEDNVNSYDGVAASLQFSALYSPPEGTYSVYIPGTAGTLYLPPTYDDDSIPNAFTFAFWYLRSASTGDENHIFENINNKGETAGLALFIDAEHNHLEVRGEVGNVNNEARMGGDGVDVTDGAWHHLVWMVTRSTGAVVIFIDGARIVLTDSVTTANIDFSGPWQIGRMAYGYMDDLQLYPKLLTNAEVAFIYANPGTTITGGGTVPDPPDPGTGESDFTAYADSIAAWDFEEPAFGTFTSTEAEAYFLDCSIMNWNMDPDGDNDIQIDTVQAGYYETITEQSKVFKSWSYKDANANVAYHGHQLWCPIPGGNSNKEVWLSYNICLDPDWLDEDGEYKTPGFLTDYNRFASDQNTGQGMQSCNLIKGGITYGNRRLGPYVWWYENPDEQYGWTSWSYQDPTTGTTLHLTPGQWYNITTRLKLGTNNGNDGLYEVFLDGTLLNSAPVLINTTFKSSSTDWGVTWFKFYSFLTFSDLGDADDDGIQDGAPTQDQYIAYDDIYLFRYKTTWDGYVSGPSPAGRKILLPNWDTDNGVKLER